MSTIKYHTIISLSHLITEHIPIWPGDPQVHFTPVARRETDGFYLRKFSLGEHSATHMNAPNSFIDDAPGIESYPAASLVVAAVVVDVVKAVQQNADYCISVADILAWEDQYGRIPQDTMVLFSTGWDLLWNSPTHFINADRQGRPHFPGVAGQTTRFLLDERHIAGLAIDTHGLDPCGDSQYPTNTQLLAERKIAIECIAHLQDLPATGITLVIGVLPLQGGSGSPVSIMALV